MALSMVVLAIQGAAAKVRSTPGSAWHRLRLALTLAYLFFKEISGGLISIIPWASRSLFLYYASLPSHGHDIPPPDLHHQYSSTAPAAVTAAATALELGVRDDSAEEGADCAGASSLHFSVRRWRWRRRGRGRWRILRVATSSVSVARSIRYGPAPRNLLDVYVPPPASGVEGLEMQGTNDTTKKQQQQQPPPRRRNYYYPVVVFVHGGVWASGNKELFAHVGASLAKHGVLAVVVQYTLFPHVLAREQVREVSTALSWVMDNVADFGGDPTSVTLMGHSAGAHLAAMVVWERFQRGYVNYGAKGGRSSSCWAGEEEGDIRQPRNFVGLAGVYDIAEHREYETRRGVESLSCMTPAMGGLHLLPSMSPVRLFDNLLTTHRYCCAYNHHHHINSQSWRNLKSTFDDGGGDWRWKSLLPQTCSLFSSLSDTVVPHDTSLAFHRVLTATSQQLLQYKDVRSNITIYKKLRHSDFVLFDGRTTELLSHSRHILDIIIA